ncbi:MAG: hypothetical protein ACN4EU_04140 [Brevundimonas mediterranea]
MMTQDWKAEGEDYQAVATLTREVVARLLRKLFALELVRSGRRDMGPFIVGDLGGIIEVVSETDTSMAELRAQLLETFDTVAPQFEMHRTAAKAGAAHRAGGRA